MKTKKNEHFDEAIKNLVIINNPYTSRTISYNTRARGKRITAYSLNELARKVKKEIGSEFAFPEEKKG